VRRSADLSTLLTSTATEINRTERLADAQKRAKRKATDKKRKKCRCEAYPWPHRPTGGLCRWPDPPVEKYARKGTRRPYRTRYSGLARQLARASGMHPIRDRDTIAKLLPRVVQAARDLHHKHPQFKYRNMTVSEVTTEGFRLTGTRQTAGPCM
jgi:hypothetical protein